MHVVRFLCLAILLFAGPVAWAGDEASMVIGTGPRGSDTYSSGGAICRSVNRVTPYHCTVLETGVSVDNLYALNLTDAHFAIVQQDIEAAAQSGRAGIFGDYSALRPVVSLYTMALTIVTRADNPARSFEELGRGRVAAGTLTSGSNWTFRALLDGMNMAEGDRPTVIDVDGRNGMALCKGMLDAVVIMTGHPSLTLSRMADRCAIRVLPLGVNAVRTMSARNRNYRPMAVPPGMYSFVPAPVPTIGTDAMIVALASTPDAQVTNLLNAIFTDQDAIARQLRIIATRPSAISAKADRCHPAAMRFFSAWGLGQ